MILGEPADKVIGDLAPNFWRQPGIKCATSAMSDIHVIYNYLNPWNVQLYGLKFPGTHFSVMEIQYLVFMFKFVLKRNIKARMNLFLKSVKGIISLNWSSKIFIKL